MTKPMIKKLIVACAALALSLSLYAQGPGGGVKGTVVTRGTNEPVQNARLDLFSGAELIGTALSAEDGTFMIPDLADGMYTLVISSSEYMQNTVNVTVNDGYVKNMFNLSLTPTKKLEILEDATLMRGLPMDYPEDPEVRDLSDQWMLGPAFMACPVYEYKARSRSVYFPMGGWYDFYTGKYMVGGKRFTVDAPYERMPLYVRAGSIVPFGPAIEYTGEKQADKIVFVIYAGADAHFTLYEDDGLTYGYEKGACSTIDFSWKDDTRILTISPRKGSFPGMLKERMFCLTVVDPQNPQPYDAEGENALCFMYDGTLATIGL